MKTLLGSLSASSIIIAFLGLTFNLIAVQTYPGLIGTYFIEKITSETALFLGIFGAITGAIWCYMELRAEKKEKQKNQRFHDHYGSF